MCFISCSFSLKQEHHLTAAQQHQNHPFANLVSQAELKDPTSKTKHVDSKPTETGDDLPLEKGQGDVKAMRNEALESKTETASGELEGTVLSLKSVDDESNNLLAELEDSTG